jgi:hypothetical protein
MFDKLANRIAGVSTHDRYTYYKSPAQFLQRLSDVLREFGYVTPQFALYLYNMEGCGYIDVTRANKDKTEFRIYYTYYRMPSYNWEFVCYVTN